jgi:hypothetical protein
MDEDSGSNGNGNGIGIGTCNGNGDEDFWNCLGLAHTRHASDFIPATPQRRLSSSDDSLAPPAMARATQSEDLCHLRRRIGALKCPQRQQSRSDLTTPTPPPPSLVRAIQSEDFRRSRGRGDILRAPRRLPSMDDPSKLIQEIRTKQRSNTEATALQEQLHNQELSSSSPADNHVGAPATNMPVGTSLPSSGCILNERLENLQNDRPVVTPTSSVFRRQEQLKTSMEWRCSNSLSSSISSMTCSTSTSSDTTIKTTHSSSSGSRCQRQPERQLGLICDHSGLSSPSSSHLPVKRSRWCH